MLNSGKKIRALRDKKKNILTLVLSEKKILNETKNHNPSPPFKLNGRSLKDKVFVNRQHIFTTLYCQALYSQVTCSCLFNLSLLST